MADDGVPIWWVLAFLLLALGVAVGVVSFVGGSITGSVVVPVVPVLAGG